MKRRILGTIGVILAVVGLMGTLPANLHQNTTFLLVSGFFVILGVVLITIGFGD